MPIQSKQQPPYYTSTLSPKRYVALLTQTGTNAPVATILLNTLDGTPTWTRNSEGDYQITLTDAFPLTKTILIINSTSQNYDVISAAVGAGTNSREIMTYYNGDDSFSDDILLNTPIIIEVYP